MIEYLKEENKILREKLGKKRVILNDSQRRRLAILGKKVDRKLLSGISSFSPDTLLKWHRQLVAQKYDGSKNRSKCGRPRISDELKQLIIDMAKDNKHLGCRKLHG